jgi:hypothetical protein
MRRSRVRGRSLAQQSIDAVSPSVGQRILQLLQLPADDQTVGNAEGLAEGPDGFDDHFRMVSSEADFFFSSQNDTMLGSYLCFVIFIHDAYSYLLLLFMLEFKINTTSVFKLKNYL